MAGDFLPTDGQSVNYTQIFFRWPQIVDADSYELNIYNEVTSENYSSENNAMIVENLDWGQEYFWEACGLDEFNNKDTGLNTLSMQPPVNTKSNFP